MSARSRSAAVVRGTGLLSYGALGFGLSALGVGRLPVSGFRLQAIQIAQAAIRKQQADGAAPDLKVGLRMAHQADQEPMREAGSGMR
jgi:hypothetical protein